MHIQVTTTLTPTGMRCGIMGEMSETVKKEVFAGKFPVYSFMYTLRRFIRMNSIKKSEIDEFVSIRVRKKVEHPGYWPSCKWLF